MTVAASIILAAVVGGIIFVLLDSWQRRATTATGDRPTRSRPSGPSRRARSRSWDVDRSKPEGPQDSLWSGWAGRRSAGDGRPRSPPRGGGRCRSSRRRTFRCGSSAVSAA